MKLLHRVTSIVMFAMLVFFATCKKNDVNQRDRPPIADAGADQKVILPTYVARLTSEGPEYESYNWRRISGPSAFRIDSPYAKTTLVSNLEEGVYLFELKVKNAVGLTATDTVKLTVEGSGIAPIALAGNDLKLTTQTCKKRLDNVTLDGSASHDPDNTQLSYSWKKLTGQAEAYVASPTLANTMINNLLPGTYSFELTVKDAGGKSARDTIQVAVEYDKEPYDLNLSFTTPYTFADNSSSGYYYYSGVYSDMTSAYTRVSMLGRDDYNFSLTETADSSNLSGLHSTNFNITDRLGNSVFASGDCSVFFRNLIVNGGGTFSGTMLVTNTSALDCNPDALSKMVPLTISGTLNTATNTLNVSITGKVFL